MSVAFWSIELKVGKPVVVQPPEGYVLNVQLAALSGEGTGSGSVVRVETLAIEGETLNSVLCTLRPKTAEQCNVNLIFGYDVNATFSVTGDAKNSVFLNGYYQPAPEDGDEDEDDFSEGDEEDDNEEESEEEEAPKLVKPSAKPTGAAAAAPAKKEAAPAKKMVVEEDSGSDDDSDELDEEDSVDEAFIKVC
jgi:cell division septation protein DedD